MLLAALGAVSADTATRHLREAIQTLEQHAVFAGLTGFRNFRTSLESCLTSIENAIKRLPGPVRYQAATLASLRGDETNEAFGDYS